jgi:hypothetical protein
VGSEPTVNVQRRLEDLECLVRRICSAVDLDVESSTLLDFETSTTEALKRLQEDPTAKSTSDENRSPRRGCSESDVLITSVSRTDHFEDAPLLNLFKEAMLLQEDDPQASRDQLDLSAEPQIKTTIKALKALIPGIDSLTSILEVTEKFWPIWPIAPTNTASSSGQQDPVVSARDFIHESMGSEKPALVAKAILWLALCIQQLPGDLKYQSDLPATPNTLLCSYLAGANTLLPVDNDSAGSIEVLECLLLQEKLYINMGRPRKAWLSVRRAVNLCLLLGLHHPKEATDERHSALWLQVWQTERHLSLILGFPYAIPDAHISLTKEPVGHSVAARVMYHLGMIAGHLIDRNQSYRRVDYPVTEHTEQELERCREQIPMHFWSSTANPAMPLETIYTQEVVKFLYYNLCKMLHLPYMLKASVEKKFERNRTAALAAARGMIKCYQMLQNSTRSTLIVCDLMDFHVFSAAIVIVIGLLWPSSTRDSHQETSDRELIRDLMKSLKHLSRIMDCSVAGQAAQILEHLLSAHEGTYSGPEPYKTIIPYFGRVRISRIGRDASQTGLPTPSTDRQDDAAQQPFANTVEISTDSYIPFSHNPMTDNLSEAELGIDWTSILDLDNQYDWNQLVYNEASGAANTSI